MFLLNSTHLMNLTIIRHPARVKARRDGWRAEERMGADEVHVKCYAGR